jgi:hypothetical protein
MRLVSRSRLHRLGQVPVLHAFPDFGLSAGVTGSDLSHRFGDRMALQADCHHIAMRQAPLDAAMLTGSALPRDEIDRQFTGRILSGPCWGR